MPVIAIFMSLMGIALAGIWTRDIISAQKLDISAGRLRARDPQAGTLMLPHWIAEYGTAAGLVAGAVGVSSAAGWGRPLALAALGALVYTSINSLGWAIAERARISYAVPMVIGAVGGMGSIVVLVVGGPMPT